MITSKKAATNEMDSFDKLFSAYSALDIATALFVFATWTKNRASDLRIMYAYTYFLSSNNFSKTDKIKTYEDFSFFVSLLIKLMPRFRGLQDFVPEGDWGQLNYYYNKQNFKFIYGGEISWTYDFLSNFEVVYQSMDDEIQAQIGMSPLSDFEQTLKLGNETIIGLPLNCHNLDSSDGVVPGHAEIPPKEYWGNCKSFLHDFDPKNYSMDFIEKFSRSLGSIPIVARDENRFVELVFNGSLFNCMLIKIENRIFPMSPRWLFVPLIEFWNKQMSQFKEKLNIKGPPKSIRIGIEVGKFAKRRIREENVNLLVSATEMGTKPDDFIFPFTIISRNTLYLFCFLSPHFDKSTIKNKLEELKKGIESAKKRFEKEVSLLLHLDRNIAVYQGNQSELTPQFVVVLPTITTGALSFDLPNDLRLRVILSIQLLGVLDELKNADELFDFFEFMDQNQKKTAGLISPLDLFGAFRDSNQILIEGAVEPSFVSIDPHWGANYRFRSLSKFWSLFPKTNFFSHPRSWFIEKETKTRMRLRSRSFFGSAIHFRIGDADFFINAPYESMDRDSSSIANMMSECIEDYLSSVSKEFKHHRFFRENKNIQILLFPKEVVEGDPKFEHLKHLVSKENPWDIDYGVPDSDWIGIRLVFSIGKMMELFSGVNGREGEIKLCSSVIESINKIVPDNKALLVINKKLFSLKVGKPRYTITSHQKSASFPDVAIPIKPTSKHFKLAQKTIAILAKKADFERGKYTVDQAKKKIESILDKIVSEINNEVSKFEFKSSIEILLENIDSFVHADEMMKIQYQNAKQRDIAYDLTKEMTKQHQEFINTHRVSRYIIEKFVQLKPNGTEKLEEEKLGKLMALVDWFQVFVSAGDQIFHDILPGGIEIDSQYKVSVTYPKSSKSKSDKFGEYVMKRRAKLVGRPSDEVKSPTKVEEYVNSVDLVFSKNLGFTFKILLNILQVLAKWGYFSKDGEKTSYKVEKSKIIALCVKEIPEASEKAIESALEFLTLKQENMLRVIGKKSYPELPIWEHYKRHSRYLTRPLIYDGQHFLWGPYSTYKAGILWSGSVQEGSLPVDLENQEIKDCLLKEKSLVERELEKMAFKIVNRFTRLCEANVYLHKRDKTAGYPDNLGDYDVLAYLENYNILLNIECKHLQQVFALKDSKDLREELFGKDSVEGSYVGKVLKRDGFLKKNWQKVCSTMKWKAATEPKVFSIFCSRELYMWTFNPPIETEIYFSVIDELHDFIDLNVKKT